MEKNTWSFKKDIKKNYDYLGVNFDLWLGESDSYNDIKETEELLKSKNLLTLSDGALVVDVKEDTDKKEIPPLLFKKVMVHIFMLQQI